MSFEALRDEVCAANHALAAAGLVSLAFGNASGADRAAGVFVIKPSGIACDRVQPEDLVVVRIADEIVVEGSLRPSSDTPTHAVLYRRFDEIGGVAHTHSTAAAAWAQAGRSIPVLGTTHADHFGGPIPVTAALGVADVGDDYERRTGEVLADTIDVLGLDPLRMPAGLVRSHGPFTWGRTATEAATNAVALELVATMALQTVALAADVAAIDDGLLERHFGRKHGPGAYYGQAPVAEGSAEERSGEG